MLYIPVGDLKPGMVLASDINLGIGHIALLTKGQILTSGFVEKIQKKEITGVYIETGISQGVEVKEVISKKLRNVTLSSIKRIFENYAKTDKINESSLRAIARLAKNLVDNLLNNDEILVNLGELKSYDDYTYCHSLSVALLSITIGIKMGYAESVLEDLAASALLHDLGKMKIPLELLHKPGKLTREEFETIKSHPALGYEQLRDCGIFSASVIMGVCSHHEKYDGTGYPKGLKGEEIPLYGRVLAVADVYDALTSNRPYRSACFPNEAIEYMMGCAGSHFEFDILKAFLKGVAAYPAGMLVRLSNGATALVVKNFQENPLRPLVRLLGATGKVIGELDLLHDPDCRNITIVDTGYDRDHFNIEGLGID